jgi:ABC-2 type transport system ATP-binding protein
LTLAIETIELTKDYAVGFWRKRPRRVLDRLSLRVEAGEVFGFLGPNGAGKTTTMRLVLGLDRPTRGQVTIAGKHYADYRFPLYEVGALLDAKYVHGGRRARDHLLCLAQSNRIPRRRVAEVLELVGLSDVARRRVATFSLGMSQRLGIAAALLGDPEVLMFDEPVNGLDPEGIVWIRNLFRSLADEGRTVFVSSHLMSEMALTADHLIVIGRGKLIADERISDLLSRGVGRVRVSSPELERLTSLLEAQGARVDRAADGAVVHDLAAPAIGEIAAHNQIVLHELTPEQASLEETFFELTNDSVEFHGEDAVSRAPAR